MHRLAFLALLLATVACEPFVMNKRVTVVRTFVIERVVEGQTERKQFVFSETERDRAIPLVTIDRYEAPASPTNPEAVRMMLAFQLKPGKTREDFVEFKKLDLPWVVSNHGSNRATFWTERTPEWDFDAFEDVTFKSIEDFKKAYAGNDELAKAGEGLFDDKVLCAVVK